MNIEQAKTIAIITILSKLNFEAQRKKGHQAWYISPFRNEKTASFKVNTKTNTWYDFGIGKGGDIIDFACLYLESQGLEDTVSDGLRYLKNMSGYVPIIKPIETHDYSEEDKTLVLKSVTSVKQLGLVMYAEKRGIPEFVAKKYLKQANVYNKDSDKTFYALGLRNEDGGYELRNPLFKGCVGKKHITVIRGTNPNLEGIHIFEGIMDFLSVVTQQNGEPFKDDVIILNTLSCLQQGAAYIKGFGYRTGYTWMDNDEAGKKATQSWNDFFATEENLVHMPMNDLYANHKDVNEAHMHKLGLC